MGFFEKLIGKKTQRPETPVIAPAASASDKSQPSKDPNSIQVFDKFGREFSVTREQWRTDIFPGTLKSNWDNADSLSGIVVGGLDGGFIANVLGAAEHLHRIDANRERSACVYGFAQIKNNQIDEAERILRSYLEQHGDSGIVLTNLAKVYAARNETKKV